MIRILFLLVIVASSFSLVKPTKPEFKAKAPMFAGVHIITPAMSEYVDTYLYSDSNVYAFIFTGSVKFQPFSFGGRKIISVAPGFNQFISLDDQGYVWKADLGSTSGTRINTDTFGNAFNNNGLICGYFYTYLSVSKDSSTIYTWGNGSYGWFTNPVVQPYPLHAPAGKKWVQLAAGNNLLARTSTGEVWKWDNGDTNYVQMTTPGACTYLGASHNDFYVGAFHDYSGGNASLGSAYWFGSQPGYIGDNSSRATWTSLTGIFKTTSGGALPYHLKQVVCHDNTVLFTDSINDLYSEGDFAQGEGGNGQDTVIKYQYSNQYAWTTIKGEGYTNGKCYLILHNIKFIPYGTSYTFYGMAVDMNDSLLFWGRNKSFVLPTGYVSNTESTKPNALDIVTPVMGSGFQNPNGVSVNFVAPTMSAGSNQNISTTSATLTVSGNPTQMGGWGYSFATYQWTQVSGPSSTINSPTASSTTVTLTTPGAYRYRMTTFDTQTASDTASVLVTFATTGCGGCTVMKQYRTFKKG
jgi:hypothetical protein